jgi:hypothetical protein
MRGIILNWLSNFSRQYLAIGWVKVWKFHVLIQWYGFGSSKFITDYNQAYNHLSAGFILWESFKFKYRAIYQKSANLID